MWSELFHSTPPHHCSHSGADAISFCERLCISITIPKGSDGEWEELLKRCIAAPVILIDFLIDFLNLIYLYHTNPYTTIYISCAKTKSTCNMYIFSLYQARS